MGAQRTENPFRRSVPKTKSAAKPWKVQPTRLFAFSTRKSGILCFAHTAIIIIVLLAVASLRLVSVSMPATLGCDRTGTATGISFDVGSDTLRPPVRAKRRGGWREGMPKPPDRDVRLRGYEVRCWFGKQCCSDAHTGDQGSQTSQDICVVQRFIEVIDRQKEWLIVECVIDGWTCVVKRFIGLID